MNKKTTLLSLKCLFVFAFAQMLHAQQIYTNGPLSTDATSKSGAAAPAGYTWSELQNDTGNTTQTNVAPGTSGWYNTAATTSFSLADDFVVPAGAVWDITSLEVFLYQTSSTALPIDELRVMIYSGVPGATGTTLVAGSTTANVLDAANSGEAMMYRIVNSAVPTTTANPLTNRKIWKAKGNLTASLQAGTYWVVYQYHPISNTTNTLSPHVTITGSRAVAGANAKSKISSTANWVDIADVGNPATGTPVPCALPFIINGTAGVASVANDACTGALVAASLPYTHVQTLGNLSTNNGGFITNCVSGSNDGLWYSFTGTGNNVDVAITNVDVLFDAQINVYTGTCGAFTCVGSANDDVDGGDETVTIPTVSGTTYYVNIGYYSATVDGAEGNFTISLTPGLGTDGFSNGSFKAYPNPVKDILNLSYTQQISNVEVYNVLGQQVAVKANYGSQAEVDMSQLAPGTYMVKVFADNEQQTIKVVKN